MVAGGLFVAFKTKNFSFSGNIESSFIKTDFRVENFKFNGDKVYSGQVMNDGTNIIAHGKGITHPHFTLLHLYLIFTLPSPLLNLRPSTFAFVPLASKLRAKSEEWRVRAKAGKGEEGRWKKVKGKWLKPANSFSRNSHLPKRHRVHWWLC